MTRRIQVKRNGAWEDWLYGESGSSEEKDPIILPASRPQGERQYQLMVRRRSWVRFSQGKAVRAHLGGESVTIRIPR